MHMYTSITYDRKRKFLEQVQGVLCALFGRNPIDLPFHFVVWNENQSSASVCWKETEKGSKIPEYRRKKGSFLFFTVDMAETKNFKAQ